MEEIKSRVYIVTDDNNRVIQIEGEYTLSNIADLSSAILVEEGAPCDRLNHAQNYYLPTSLMNLDGVWVYKWNGEEIVGRSEEEIEADRREMPVPAPSAEEQLRADVDFLLMIMEDQ